MKREERDDFSFFKPLFLEIFKAEILKWIEQEAKKNRAHKSRFNPLLVL